MRSNSSSVHLTVPSVWRYWSQIPTAKADGLPPCYRCEREECDTRRTATGDRPGTVAVESQRDRRRTERRMSLNRLVWDWIGNHVGSTGGYSVMDIKYGVRVSQVETDCCLIDCSQRNTDCWLLKEMSIEERWRLQQSRLRSRSR